MSKCLFLLGRFWIRVGISADLPIESFDQSLSFGAELEPTITTIQRYYFEEKNIGCILLKLFLLNILKVF